MLAVGLRVRAKVVGRFDEVRRGLQENQRRHRGCESSWPRIPRILHCQCKCTSASTRGRCPRGPENFLFGLGRGDVPLYGAVWKPKYYESKPRIFVPRQIEVQRKVEVGGGG